MQERADHGGSFSYQSEDPGDSHPSPGVGKIPQVEIDLVSGRVADASKAEEGTVQFHGESADMETLHVRHETRTGGKAFEKALGRRTVQGDHPGRAYSVKRTEMLELRRGPKPKGRGKGRLPGGVRPLEAGPQDDLAHGESTLHAAAKPHGDHRIGRGCIPPVSKGVSQAGPPHSRFHQAKFSGGIPSGVLEKGTPGDQPPPPGQPPVGSVFLGERRQDEDTHHASCPVPGSEPAPPRTFRIPWESPAVVKGFCKKPSQPFSMIL